MLNADVVLCFMRQACAEGGVANVEDAMLLQLLQECGIQQQKEKAICSQEGLSRFLDCYEKRLRAHREADKGSSSAWQRALSSVRLRQLDSLLSLLSSDIDEVLQKLDKELWQVGEMGSCAFPGLWRRFVACFCNAGSLQVEEVLVRVLGDGLPKIVHVPNLAEKEAHKNRRVILSYEGHYFEVSAEEASISHRDPQGPGDEVLDEERGENRDAKVPRVSFWQRVSRLFRRDDSTKKRKGIEAQGGEPATREKKSRLPEGTRKRGNEEEKRKSKRRKAEAAGKALTQEKTEEPRKSLDPEEKKTWSQGDGFLERFLLSPEELQDPVHRPLPQFAANVKCSESFLKAMRTFLPPEVSQRANDLQTECRKVVLSISQMQNGCPLGLTKEEFFALAAYAFDIRQKFPDAPVHQNFYVHLRKSVRQRDRGSLEDLGAYLQHWLKGLEKQSCVVEEPIYCAMPASDKEAILSRLRDASLVCLATSISCTPDLGVAAAAAGEGGAVIKLMPKTVCDLTEVNRLCHAPQGPELLVLPNTLLRASMPKEPGGHVIAELAAAEEVEDDDF